MTFPTRCSREPVAQRRRASADHRWSVATAHAPIDLAEYDPDWPRLFTREADRLRDVLGDLALRVEHVGSTSVPGLLAKPITDILLVVRDSGNGVSYVPRLEAAGYVLRHS